MVGEIGYCGDWVFIVEERERFRVLVFCIKVFVILVKGLDGNGFEIRFIFKT